MTTEDMVETFIEEGIKAYKKNSRGSLEARKLSRHETVVIEGIEFNYWREYVVYRMAQYIKEILPDGELEVELDGNDSVMTITLSDEEQKKLNSEMYRFLSKLNKENEI